MPSSARQDHGIADVVFHIFEMTFELSTDLTCIAPYTADLLWHWARTRDMPTMIRYLDHLATPATGPSPNALE
ncbi:hypothetical protein TNCV_2835321 [Trichonephila clavipes]|uniref:Uncharacterized protein n=1 Tax=Trichonephila clavipes TaxID=2585209 RepID=A0A8X6RWP2_TRICX|nr:hypothetical protein TNCV_2835321 [Trichonephila clavipes]